MKTRPTFSPEFRLEVAQQVVEHGRKIAEVADTFGVGKSTVDKWVRQLRAEQKGHVSTVTPLTPEQLKIRELERKIKRLEEDNDILKIPKGYSEASALLMQDSIKGFR